MTVKQYDIELNYRTEKAEQSLAAFRAGVVRAFQDLQSRTAKIEVLKDLQKDAADANAAVVKLKDRSAELTAVLGKLGKGDVGFKQLAAEVKATETSLKAAEKAAGTIADKIRLLDGELRAAGIDTKNLAAEQLALAKALEASQRAMATQAARQTLGVVSTDEARAQIAKLQQAYELLRSTGTASVAELAKAKQLLTQRTIELTGQQSLFEGQLREVGVAMLGLVGSVTAYTAGMRGAIIAASQYEQGLASVASITSLNKRQLDELGEGVLRLSARIGIDGVEAFRALYNIIGSGVPAENSLRVLEASSKAAGAGITSIENAARISVQVLNAYQLQIGQLDRVHDILFQTVRDGVISFEDLADKFGTVLPAARTAGVSLEELSAATVVLTRNGLIAPRAMTALEGAIKQLAAPTVEAAGAMAELGITYSGFASTLQQLATKNIGPELLRRLIPDVEGQRAVALLTNQFGLFRSSLEEANSAAGATAEAFEKLKNTPEQAYKRFTAEVNNLQVASGKALLEGLMPMLDGVTSLIRAYGELPPAVRGSVGVVAAVGGALGVAAIAARTLTPLLAPLAAGLAEVGAAGVIAAGGVNAARGALVNFLPAVVGGALGYEFGKSWRENDAIIRSFGNSIGVTVGYLQQGAGALIDYAVAFARSDRKAMAEATAALARNEQQYNEEIAQTIPALAELEIRQGKLKIALEEAQKAVGAAGAKFREAFSEIVEAVDKPLNEVNARIGNTSKQVEAAIGRIGASAATLKDVFAAQSAEIERVLAEQTQAIELLVSKRELTEVQAIKRLADANTKANTDRLASLNEYAASAKKAFEAEAASRLALAQKSGADVKKLEIEIAASRIGLINELAGRYSKYIADAQRAEEGLRDKIKSIDGDIRKIRAEQADFQNRAIAAASGDYLAYIDRERQANAALALAQRASGEEREQAIQRAKQLAGTLGQAVSDAYGREVDGARAASIAKGIYDRAARLEIETLEQKKVALGQAADEYAKSGKAAEGAAVNIKGTLDRLFPQETKKLTVTVDYEQEQIKAKLADLQRDLLLQAPLASVKLSVEQALADYETFKTSVERNKPSAEVQAKFDSFRQSYKEVTESLPLVRLTPDTTKVDAALTDLAGKVTAFKDSKLTLQSNVDEIAAKINALKEPTRSVHTIELRYESNGKAVPVPAAAEVPTPQKFASGGLASFDGVKAMVAARRYASGGFVGAVPGVGNRDTEFRMLAAGSFVLRKDAVRALVEQRMLGGRLANGVSGNASDGSLAGLIEALNSASVFSRSAPMGAMFDAAFRAQDASIKALRAKFPLGYVEPNAEAFSRSLAQPRVDAVRAEYERARGSSNATAADAATKSAIAIAEGIATPARGLSFDDLKAFAEARAADQAEAKARGEAQKAGMSFEAYLEYIDRLQKEEAAKKAAESSAQPPAQKRADGGSVSGGALIPALLTPGEMVFGPAAVRSIGLGNLELLNAMRFNAGGLVPGALAALASMPPPGIQAMTENLARFNAGGAVTNNNASTSNTNNYGGVSVTINAGGTADARQLARGLVDELNNIARRRK